MSSRRSFLDADKSIMERNLRFVKNDLEENLSHYFGGSSGRDNNSPHYSAPPRDYKVVQPNPEADLNERASLNEVEKRRRFLLQLGFTRHVAYDLAKCANISIDRLHQNYNEYLDRGFSQDEILERISCGIRNPMNCLDNSHLEQDMLRKTPSPPPPPKISLYCGDQTNLHYDSRSYSDREDLLQSHFRETSRNQPSEITYFSNNSFDVCHEINSDKSLPHNEYNSKSDNMFSDIQPSTSKASMENSSHMSSRECGSAVSWLNESFSATQLRNVKKKDDNMNSSCQIEVFNASIQIPKEFSNTEALISSLEYNSTREKRSFAENLNKKPDQEHLNSLHWVYDYLAEAESKSTYDIGEPSRKDIGKLRVAANTVRKLSKNSAKGLDEIDLKQLTWAKNFLGSWQVYLRELKSKSVEDRFHIKSKLPAEKPVKYCSTNSFVEDAPLIRAIIDRNDPDGAISVDNWNIVVNHLIREFRKIVMDNPGTLIQCSDAGWHSQGLVRLVSCPNELSVVYLEQTVRAIKGLRKTVILDVVNIEKIPRRPRVTAIVLCEPSDRNEILQLLQLGNPDIPTQDWKIVSVGAPKKSFRRITVIVNEQSLGILLKKRCKMYYGFESIRLSVSRNTIEVTEGSTGLGDNISNFVCQDDSWEPVNQSAYEKAYLNTDREDGCVLNTFKEDICKGNARMPSFF